MKKKIKDLTPEEQEHICDKCGSCADCPIAFDRVCIWKYSQMEVEVDE